MYRSYLVEWLVPGTQLWSVMVFSSEGFRKGLIFFWPSIFFLRVVWPKMGSSWPFSCRNSRKGRTLHNQGERGLRWWKWVWIWQATNDGQHHPNWVPKAKSRWRWGQRWRPCSRQGKWVHYRDHRYQGRECCREWSQKMRNRRLLILGMLSRKPSRPRVG